MMKKLLAITGLAALIATPAFAFAESGKGKDMRDKMFDKTQVSISIAGDGSALVRGAKVTDVGSASITAATVVNGVTLSWTVDIDSGTDFVEADGDAMALADVSDGDYVSFSGTLTGATRIDADVVRNWSVDDDGNGEEHDNGQKRGLWNRLQHLPFFSFWAGAKADIR